MVKKTEGRRAKSMNKKDKLLLDSLRTELEKSSDSAQIPLRLQKESIVSLLNDKGYEKQDFSDKTGTKNENIIILRRLAATAAMLAIIVVGALAARSNDVKMTKVDTFYENSASVNQIKNAKSDRDVENAIKEIISRNANSQAVGNNPSVQQPSAQPTQSAQQPPSAIPPQGQTQSPVGSYENLVAVKEENTDNSGIYGASYTFTNSGVVSLSEDYHADIVKKDGDFLYIVAFATNQETGGMIEQIKIVKAVPAKEMKVVSTVALSEYSSAETVDKCIEIHVKNGRLIALISRTDSSTKKVSTVAVYYDISNPEAPAKIREHVQEGSYVFSSLQENNLCLVTDKSVTSLSDSEQAIPSYSVDGKPFVLDAKKEIFMVNDPDASYIFITVTDISDFSRPVGRLAILGSGKKLYCFPHAITFAREFMCVEANKDGIRENKTEICRFNLDGTSVTFAGSYMIDGALVGGLSLDEESGTLRAITAGAESSNIYVFGKNMEPVSANGISHSGESAVGSKFIGSNGYIVVEGENGEQTLVIDLSNPEKPSAAGKIATEGFSDSLHIISDNLVLGTKSEEVFVEKEVVNEKGEVTVTEEKAELVTFTLFDVSDPHNPKVAAAHTVDINHAVLSSNDSRGVIVIPEKNMFGIPVKMYDEKTRSEASAYMMFDVSGKTFVNAGCFNHSETVIGSAATRSLYENGVLYTVSGEKIVAFSINDCSILAESEIK